MSVVAAARKAEASGAAPDRQPPNESGGGAVDPALAALADAFVLGRSRPGG